MNFLKNNFDFQVLLSSFMGPYFLFYILTLCIYPVKTYTGEFACYLMIYSRSVYVRKSLFYIDFHKTLSSCFKGKIPSSMYSCSLSHILEHEFFCLGRLGSPGSKGKKVDLSFSEQLLRVVFSTFCGQKKLDFFLTFKL